MKRNQAFSEKQLRRLENSARAQQRSLNYYESLLITARANPKDYDIRDIQQSIRYYQKSLTESEKAAQSYKALKNNDHLSKH